MVLHQHFQPQGSLYFCCICFVAAPSATFLLGCFNKSPSDLLTLQFNFLITQCIWQPPIYKGQLSARAYHIIHQQPVCQLPQGCTLPILTHHVQLVTLFFIPCENI